MAQAPAGNEIRLGHYLPAALLVVAMLSLWLAFPFALTNQWGVSAAALEQGQYRTILLHLFVHGGWLHVIMNSAALLEVGGLVVALLGGGWRSLIRFFAVFILAGLSSMIFYISFHMDSAVPLIGASGAIYGLVGLLLFMRISDEFDPVPISQFPRAAVQFMRNNYIFLLLLLISSGLAGLSPRVAWEAHVGGFLFGMTVGPWLVPIDRAVVPLSP